MFMYRRNDDTDMSETKISEKLGVGLTHEEKRQIRIEAAKRDLSMSELARQILMAEIVDDADTEIDADTNTGPAAGRAE